MGEASGARRPWSPIERDDDPLSVPGSARFSCLTEVELFADLSAAERAEMDVALPARTVRRGELIYSQAEPVSALFILKAGRVRIFRLSEDGKALTMAILGPGAVFGEMLLVGQRMYDNYAEAIEDSIICQLDAQQVEQRLLADPRIAVRVSRLLGDRVAALETRLLDLAVRPLSARVASTLLALADGTEGGPAGAGPAARPLTARLGPIRLTHEQIAGLLGATREATSRVLAELAANGTIRQSRGRIVVQDDDGLRALAQQGGPTEDRR
ncbi:Crp/Fnr family transcriptional regulator [Agromyces sp. ISL-38]|uniref:Crp/Fnr family transcriptional regulator n=1 Tax=Agromyces sp. ISL-38 TaxID=2819107 RepID=UPI001BE726B7|nr:Crp/Fnr family transcriptional regulator [Agromyces sp. ISL-38]MBT2500279.1 Crp/Fnr family transcriptional regulator [Agromyces sp. ISL-38]